MNEAIAHLEELGGEVMMVQLVCSQSLDAGTSAIIVVRTPAASNDGFCAHDTPLMSNSGSHADTQSRAGFALRTARDLELGRRMQEERALAKPVRGAHPR